jgi:Ca-activated chloride channel homolog
VVAPRYVPGMPLDGANVGAGVADDTDAAPDASTISPPVLLPGAPNPVRLALTVAIDPAGLDVHDLRSSLHDVVVDDPTERNVTTVRLRPGERVDRDFVLRFAVGGSQLLSSVTCVPDVEPGADSRAGSGTWMATVVPPEGNAPPPRDVVLVLDRSGSMSGWKMVAARRAAARIVDSLRAVDRFAVVAFDSVVETPPDLDGLVPATDRNRFRAVEFLARLDARGGTEMLSALRRGLDVLGGADERSAAVVLVTDGQVANEDQILSELDGVVRGVRLFTVGIDRAVNAGFLQRLAATGAGRCDLVESEDRLDEAMIHLHRRIAAPVVLDVAPRIAGLELVPDTTTPVHADCFAGVPLVLAGRYTGQPGAMAVLSGTDDLGGPWSTEVACRVDADAPIAPVWARAHLRDLEDRYAVTDQSALADRIVATSLSFAVLSRFTAFVAVDRSDKTDSTVPVGVVQPVELPSGWQDTAVPVAAAYLSKSAHVSYAEMELGGPPGAPAAPRQTGARRIVPPSPTGSVRDGWRGMTAADGGARPGAALDGYDARRATLTAEVGAAVADGDVTRGRRLVRELLQLRDDLASIGQPGPALRPLQRLIDALTDWIAGPTDATNAEVAAALEELGSLTGAERPRDRSRFWR